MRFFSWIGGGLVFGGAIWLLGAAWLHLVDDLSAAGASFAFDGDWRARTVRHQFALLFTAAKCGLLQAVLSWPLALQLMPMLQRRWRRVAGFVFCHAFAMLAAVAPIAHLTPGVDRFETLPGSVQIGMYLPLALLLWFAVHSTTGVLMRWSAAWSVKNGYLPTLRAS